jgi:hypothetical protein
MDKYMLSPMVFVLVSLVSGCTTEKHYPAPAPTVIHEERTSAADARAEAREGARQGAREGVHDDVMTVR